MWTLLSLFAPSVHAAELPTRFVERDGELWGIEVQVEVAPLGTVWLQLDTGVAHGLYLHGRSVPEMAGRSTAELSMTGVEAREVSVVVRDDLGGEIDRAADRVGSLGAGALTQTWLVIDFDADVVSVLAEPDAELEAAACWTALQSVDARPWIYVDEVGHVLVDTGSAPHGLWTNPKGFQLLTGVEVGDAPPAGSGQAFGKPITWVGAPAKQPLHSGPVDLGALRVTHVPERSSPKRAGILGMRPFASSGTLIVDRIGQRLGRIGGCR